MNASQHPHFKEAKQIADAMCIGRPNPEAFLRNRVLVVILDYEPPSRQSVLGSQTPQVKDFVAKVKDAMFCSWHHVTVSAGEPLLQDGRVTQIIVFGVAPEISAAIWGAFPLPPKRWHAKTNWSYPMRYRDLWIWAQSATPLRLTTEISNDRTENSNSALF